MLIRFLFVNVSYLILISYLSSNWWFTFAIYNIYLLHVMSVMNEIYVMYVMFLQNDFLSKLLNWTLFAIVNVIINWVTYSGTKSTYTS